MFDGQIEMSFGGGERAAFPSGRRQSRARWWFQRMRQVVDLAVDWQPTPRPRPIQIWFPTGESRLGTKQPARNQNRSSKRILERQICE